MNGQVLCIGGDVTRWANWGRELEENGYLVVQAADEQEASTLLRTCPVDVICINSQVMNESGGSEIAMGVNAASQHVPVVLVQTGSAVPKHFEEHVDVVIDESTFLTVGSWLIEELREIRFPMFVEWFEAWKERSSSTEENALRVY